MLGSNCRSMASLLYHWLCLCVVCKEKFTWKMSISLLPRTFWMSAYHAKLRIIPNWRILELLKFCAPRIHYTNYMRLRRESWHWPRASTRVFFHRKLSLDRNPCICKTSVENAIFTTKFDRTSCEQQAIASCKRQDKYKVPAVQWSLRLPTGLQPLNRYTLTERLINKALSRLDFFPFPALLA